MIALLDGDDFWAPEKLERQLPAFASSERIGLVYGDFVDFSRDDATDGRVITVRRFHPGSSNHLRDYFVHDGPIMPSTVVIRRAVFDDVGLFDESLRIGEDTEFHLRLAEKWRFCHVRGAFTFKRRHAGQVSWRLADFLPNAAVVTQRLVSVHPELRPLAGRRMARVHAKVGVDCALRGEWRKALRHDLHGHPSRAALLAGLGESRASGRAGFDRPAGIRGAQAAVACPAAVEAFRLRGIPCASSTW